MKPGKYITTIQWGSGMHYIVDTFDDPNQIEYSIKYHKERTDKIKASSKRGAKPEVYCWKLLNEKTGDII